MPRRREFDRAEVLNRAMEHFWAHGYEASSLKDLLAAMQIGRQSLYDTFGDKHSLFLACLEQYRDMGRAQMLAPLLAADGGLSAIEGYFSRSVEMNNHGPARACLVVNSTVELGPHDPDVACITEGFAAELHTAFATALGVAVQQGEAAVIDIGATAWHLTAVAMGLATLSKAAPPKHALPQAAASVLATLRA